MIEPEPYVPDPNRTRVNQFAEDGFRFESWETADWWEVFIFIPGRTEYIGMRRERKRFYGVVHVEGLARDMAKRIKPRFMNPP